MYNGHYHASITCWTPFGPGQVGLVLQELSMKTYHHEFVKKARARSLSEETQAVTMSFDQTNESSGREVPLSSIVSERFSI